MAIQFQSPSKAVITSVDSVISGGAICTAKPVITGTADAGSIVNIYDGVRLLGSAIVATNGAWSFTPTTDLKGGNHQFAAIAVDDMGNFGASSTPVTVTVAANTVATPIVNSAINSNSALATSATNNAQPNIGGTTTPSAQSNHDTVVMATAVAIPPSPSINWLNGRTIDGHPAPVPGANSLQGMGESGDVIKVYSGATLLGSATVDANGLWSVSALPGLAGASDIYVTQTNAAGGVSLPSNHASFGTAVARPAGPLMADDAGAAIAGGSTTNDTHPTLSGVGTAGDTIKAYDGVTLLGSVTIGADGKWAIKSPELSSGSHDLCVIETTPTGTSTAASDRVYVTVDTSTPAAPVITNLVDALGPLAGNVAPGGIATDGQPTLKGTGHAGDTINVYDGTTLLGTTKVASDGTWSFKPASALAGGVHTLHTTETNAAGKTSTESVSYPFTFTQIMIVGIYDNGVLIPNGGVAHGTVTVKGWIDPTFGAGTVALYLSGGFGSRLLWDSTYDSMTIVGDTFTGLIGKKAGVGGLDLADNGTLTIDARAVTVAGVEVKTWGVNPAILPWTFTDDFAGQPIVIPVPGAPTIIGLVDAVGTITGPITSGMTTDDSRPVVNGRGVAGDIIKLYDGQTLIGSTTVKSDGTWAVQPATALANGSHDIYATETNAEGTSDHSADIAFTVNTSTPATPAAPVMTDDNGAAIPAGGTTADIHPHMSGTGTAGDIVKVYDGSALLGSASVGTDGKWTFKLPDLSSGSHDLYVTETNAAGTSSAASESVHLVIDTGSPAAPVITNLIDALGPLAGNVASGGIATDGQPTLKGTGHAGDTINVYDGTTLLGTATVTSAGTWSFMPASPLKSGTHSLHVTETNGAGTTSDASASYAFTFTQVLITGIYENGKAIPPGGAAHGTVTVTGWIDPTFNLTAGTLYLSGGGQTGTSWASTNMGTLQISGDSFSARVGQTSGVLKTDSVTAGAFQVDFRFSGTNGTAQTMGNSMLTMTFSDDFTVADVVPSAPVITGLIDNLGLIMNGMFSSDPRPTLNGTGNPGDTIKLYDGLKVIGSTTVGFEGTWSVRPDIAMRNGTHQLFAVESNLSGASPWSTDIKYTQNSPVPATPGAPDVTDENGMSLAAGSTTAGAHLSFSGTGTAGDTINLYDGSKLIGSGMIDGNGKWTIKPSTDLWIGTHSLHVVEVSPIGMPSAASGNMSLIVSNGSLTFDPQAAYLQYGFAYSATSGDSVPIESGKGMSFTGYGEVGDVIKIYDGSTFIASVVVSGTGQWSFQNLVAFAAGSHALSATQTGSTGVESAHTAPFTFTIANVTPPSLSVVMAAYSIGDVYHALGSGDTVLANETSVGRFGGFAPVGNTIRLYDGMNLISAVTTGPTGAWLFTNAALVTPGEHSLTVTRFLPNLPETLHTAPFTYFVSDAPSSTLLNAIYGVTDDHAGVDAAALSTPQAEHVTVVGEHDTFKGTAGGNETVALAMDPTAYFKLATAHIEGAKGGVVDTLHFVGDHQVLDLTSLSGKTAAAKISGIEVVDLGGQHNTLKVSMIDVLNLGETDLFQKDGKQQLMVKGAEGDTVDLLNVRVAGLTDGEWQQHGTAQVGGVTYAVYEHSGAHTELLVQQGVQIVMH